MEIHLDEAILERALNRSRNHAVIRGNEYHDDWFPQFENMNPVFPDIDLEDLRDDNRHGIYLIRNLAQNRAYVGMASGISFGERFYHGMDDCKINCPDNCRCFGHINSTPSTCRSHQIIEQGLEYAVCFLAIIEDNTERCCQAETDWYYILLEAGYEMVNADWCLGVSGYTGRPIVTVNLTTLEYTLFTTIHQTAATLFPGRKGGAGLVGTVLLQQNQALGYVHRYANAEELDSYQNVSEITNLIEEFPSDVTWELNGEEINTEELNRNCRLVWKGGPLRQVDIDHLRQHNRGDYAEEIPQSAYKGVSWHRQRQGWQCRGKNGPGGYDIWQHGPRAEWHTDCDAALYRERKILEDGCEEYNTNRYGSNAILLNERLTFEQRNGQEFVDWEMA